jgi:hypothetical protein
MPGGERPETGDARHRDLIERLRRCPALVRRPDDFAPGGGRLTTSNVATCGSPPVRGLPILGAGAQPVEHEVDLVAGVGPNATI